MTIIDHVNIKQVPKQNSAEGAHGPQSSGESVNIEVAGGAKATEVAAQPPQLQSEPHTASPQSIKASNPAPIASVSDDTRLSALDPSAELGSSVSVSNDATRLSAVDPSALLGA